MPDFSKADECGMLRVASELAEWTESQGIEQGITTNHVVALFCLQRSMSYLHKGKALMAPWLSAGYQYAQDAGVADKQLKYAVSLLHEKNP